MDQYYVRAENHAADGCSSTHRHRSRSRAPGAVGYSPRSTGCGSSCPFAPSTPARRRSTSATNYLDAIVESLRGSGQPVRDEAVARLSPLGHAHLNCLGRYAFTTQPPAELRPLRDPNARDGEDDGEF